MGEEITSFPLPFSLVEGLIIRSSEEPPIRKTGGALLRPGFLKGKGWVRRREALNTIELVTAILGESLGIRDKGIVIIVGAEVGPTGKRDSIRKGGKTEGE